MYESMFTLIDGVPGKVLVTGGGGGIGLATAIDLVGRGYEVVATDLEVPEVTGAECRTLDVTDGTAVPLFIKDLGPVGAVVCSAGIGVHSPVERVPEDAVRRVFEVNFYGALRCAQAVLPGMRERGSGVIVNVTSNVARTPLLLTGAYAASKAALNTISQVLSYEVRRFGVRVHSVEPGAILTGFAARRMRFGLDAPPYDDLATLWQGFLERSRSTESFGPEVVAAVIAGVIENPNSKFMTSGSPDAVLRAERSRGLDEEDWRAMMLQDLGLSW